MAFADVYEQYARDVLRFFARRTLDRGRLSSWEVSAADPADAVATLMFRIINLDMWRMAALTLESA